MSQYVFSDKNVTKITREYERITFSLAYDGIEKNKEYVLDLFRIHSVTVWRKERNSLHPKTQ